MFAVFTTQGPRKVGGQPCFVWRGIPSLISVRARLGDSAVQGMLIEVSDLGLPDSRVNTYALGSLTHGSYDGRTLTVSRAVTVDTGDPDIRRSTLDMAYNGVCKLYFDIFHGRIEGERRAE